MMLRKIFFAVAIAMPMMAAPALADLAADKVTMHGAPGVAPVAPADGAA